MALAHSPPVRRTAPALTLLAATLLPAVAQGYSRHYTHPWLTREGAKLLVATYPGTYDELLDYLDEAAFGSMDEDNFILDGDTDPTTMRVMRHFYRPTDERGLTYGERPFPSSYEWSAIPNDTNTWDWGDGLRRYRQGDTAAAYETLGHVVHLVQDLTVPAHTHLDDHGSLNGDDYEKHVESMCRSETSCDLPVPAVGTAIPELGDAWEAWQATAWASYSRNLYAGDLSDQAAARGVIAEMYPSLSWSWFSESWNIDEPPVGSLGSDFFEEAPGLFYFKNTEHAPAVDKVGLGDAMSVNTDGATMVQGFARDLVPLAILHTAAVMKLFLDEAYAQAPELPEPEPEPEPAASAGGCSVGGRGGAAAASPLVLALFMVIARRRSRCAS
jgi:hypothetical protein